MHLHSHLVERFLFIVGAGWFAPPAIVGLAAFGVPVALAIPVGIALAVAGMWWAGRYLGPLMRPVVQRLPALGLAAGLLGLVADAQVARQSVFMHDPSYTSFAASAHDQWWREHCCLTAYTEADLIAGRGDKNAYDPKLYVGRYLGTLKVDPYHYPPPFLLLPGAMRLAVGEFEDVRALWFSLQAIFIAAVLMWVAWWIGEQAGALALLAVPALLAPSYVVRTLQQGNVQVTIVTMTVLAMALLWSGRVRTGGAFLAFATVGKLFPGLLVLYLVLARRWRAVMWTGVWCAALVLISLAVYGPRVFTDFVGYELPRIASGEAFPQSELPRAMTVNQSMYGLTVKLRALGVTALDRTTGRAIATAFGVLLVGLAALVAWRVPLDPTRPGDRLRAAQVWLALVTLASLQGPFSGMNYGLVGTLWLITLLAAGASDLRGYVTVLMLLSIYYVGGIVVPSPGMNPTHQQPVWAVVFTLVLQVMALAITLWPLGHVLLQSREEAGMRQPMLDRLSRPQSPVPSPEA